MRVFLLITFLLASTIWSQTTDWRIVSRSNPKPDNVLYYTTYHSLDGVSFDNVGSVADTSFTDTNMQRGVLHYYYKTATNIAGESNPSIIVSESIPLCNSIANQTVAYGGRFNQLTLSVQEPDGDVVNWSFEVTDNNVQITPNGIITYTNGWSGTVNVTATASDGVFYDLTTFFLTVNAGQVPQEVGEIWFEEVD